MKSLRPVSPRTASKHIEISFLEQCIDFFATRWRSTAAIKNSTDSWQASKAIQDDKRYGNDRLSTESRNQHGSSCRFKKHPLSGCNLRERFEGWLDAIGIGQDAVASGSSQSLRFPVQLVDGPVIGITSPWQVFARPDWEIPPFHFDMILAWRALRWKYITRIIDLSSNRKRKTLLHSRSSICN